MSPKSCQHNQNLKFVRVSERFWTVCHSKWRKTSLNQPKTQISKCLDMYALLTHTKLEPKCTYTQAYNKRIDRIDMTGRGEPQNILLCIRDGSYQKIPSMKLSELCLPRMEVVPHLVGVYCLLLEPPLPQDANIFVFGNLQLPHSSLKGTPVDPSAPSQMHMT